MEGIVSGLSRCDKRKLVQHMRRCQNGQMRIRYLIVLSCAEGTSPTEVARQLKVSRSTVYVWQSVITCVEKLVWQTDGKETVNGKLMKVFSQH